MRVKTRCVALVLVLLSFLSLQSACAELDLSYWTQIPILGASEEPIEARDEAPVQPENYILSVETKYDRLMHNYTIIAKTHPSVCCVGIGVPASMQQYFRCIDSIHQEMQDMNLFVFTCEVDGVDILTGTVVATDENKNELESEMFLLAK